MDINKNDTAVLIIDPQNDFLSEKGVTWKLVGDSVKENNTIENIERLFKAAKKNSFGFISPTTTTPPITVEVRRTPKVMHEIQMFDRCGALSLDGFSGGRDWLERYKPFIEDGKTIVSAPQVWRENNDLILQLASVTYARFLWRNVGQPLCRGPYARVDRARLRGRSREGCNGWCPASRAGRWLQGSACQLRIYRQRGAVDG